MHKILFIFSLISSNSLMIIKLIFRAALKSVAVFVMFCFIINLSSDVHSVQLTDIHQMAQVLQEKSRGLKFAERQLLRHGWEHGERICCQVKTGRPGPARVQGVSLCPPSLQGKAWGELRTAYRSPSK